MQSKNFILMISILSLSCSMRKTKAALLRLDEKKYNRPLASTILNYYPLPIRHQYHFLGKKYKCTWDLVHGKNDSHNRTKQSRYPTLDKIVDRLDHHVDQESSRSKSTTVLPYTKRQTEGPVEAGEKESKYSYVMVNVDEKTKTFKKLDLLYVGNSSTEKSHSQSNESNHLKSEDDSIDDKDDDHPKRDLAVKSKGDHRNRENDNDFGSKGHEESIPSNRGERKSIPEMTTFNPWNNEQSDIFANIRKNAKKINNNTEAPSEIRTSSASDREIGERQPKMQDRKSPFQSLNRLISRFKDGDDTKKKLASTPYGAAHEHYEQVLRMGDCRTPKQKVIKVHEVHPDPSKSYSPSCTILHQCGDDTGCCKDIKQECKAKNTTKVELYFFTTTLGKPQTVEKLYFVNHTECECQKRTDEIMPRDSEMNQVKNVFNLQPQGERDKCTCPSKYTARHFQNGTCICDCFDKQSDCISLKRGKTHFSHRDRICIHQDECLMPMCEFGSYIKQYGRCPNRREHYRIYRTKILSYRDLIT